MKIKMCKRLLFLVFILCCCFLAIGSALKWNRRTARDSGDRWAGNGNYESIEESEEEEESSGETSALARMPLFWAIPWKWPKARRLPMQRIQHRRNHKHPKENAASSNMSYKAWAEYKRKYGKSYADSKTEFERMMVFFRNLERIKKHNKLYREGRVSFDVGLNHLSDLPPEEYMKLNGFRYNLSSPIRDSSRFLPPMNVGDLPDAVDWRDHGYVTPVKDQEDCGSCWAFSATGALEGQHMRATGKLVSLSEQNLVDCSTSYGNEGCGGGLMDNAFKYVKANRGIDTEKSYPYDGEDEKCHFKRSTVGATDTGYVDLPEGDEEALKVAVATQGPISVGIDASGFGFQHYTHGVYRDEDCSSKRTALDHGVLVVGYGTDPHAGDYWIVKNSWGKEHFGLEGYILMARNFNNHCGIASAASYPLV